MILILFRKSQEVAETDFARALIEDDRIDDAATDMNNRKRQLTTIFILRTMAMVILFSWNMAWISLFFDTAEPSWSLYVEAALWLYMRHSTRLCSFRGKVAQIFVNIFQFTSIAFLTNYK